LSFTCGVVGVLATPSLCPVVYNHLGYFTYSGLFELENYPTNSNKKADDHKCPSQWVWSGGWGRETGVAGGLWVVVLDVTNIANCGLVGSQ